jgi:hypothetical protein
LIVRQNRSAFHRSFVLLPQAFGTRNFYLTQVSNRPSRRKHAVARAAKAWLSRMLSGV